MNMPENYIIPDNFICPAFTVKDGIIDRVNEGAARRGFVTGTEINSLIQSGSTEYSAYTSGILCLPLKISGNKFIASVGFIENQQVFCLESDYEESELRAFALAAQELRAPLSNALSQTAQILPLQQNSDAASSAAKLNRNLHQLLRAVCNMSDAAMYTNPNCANIQLHNAGWFFHELFEKAKDFIQQSGRDLTYSLPNKELNCCMDKDKVERAVYNLISNAIKFSPKDDTIHISVEHRNNRLYFTVRNKTTQPSSFAINNFYNRFIREPGLEDPRNGIGLGMSIVRSVAIMHNGTLLIESKDGSIYVTMTIDATIPKGVILRSPILLPTDYAGGYDHAATEMADILSEALYTE